ncbi:hypothetical protein [Dyella sp.]|uniref:hypothetical protein n=1 Tax=Dyella sp. TaxID=1869338 RepID=UPI002ED68068
MKRFMFASLILALGMASLPVVAQDQPATSSSMSKGKGQHMDPQQQLQRLTKALQLTPDQQGKIGALLQSRYQQGQSIRNDSSLKGPDKRAKIKALMESTQDQISGMLNDTQKQRWNDIREKRQERMEQRTKQ